MLRSTLRLITSSSSPSSSAGAGAVSSSRCNGGAAVASGSGHLYDRPIRRIAAETAKALDRAVALIRRCKRRSRILRRVVTITTGATDFRKCLALLEASAGDVKWLLSVYSAAAGSGGIVLSMPPIASTDPILSWVWSYVAVVQMTPGKDAAAVADRAEAAAALANLALDNERNKKIIVGEGGVPPLLALLRDGAAAVEAQIAAATALFNLADVQERVLVIVAEMGVPLIVQSLSHAPMALQIGLSSLVARMAAEDPVAQEEFARENCVRPLVTLVSTDIPIWDSDTDSIIPNCKTGTARIHAAAAVAIRSSNLHHENHHCPRHSESINQLSSARKEKENESSEVKLRLKTSCVEALWRLSAGSISNSRKITETKGLLCLAEMVKREKGELQINCLRAIAEVAAVAEYEPDLRLSAFKMNSSAAKAVVDQLLRVIQEVNNHTLQILAIKSLGCLARNFPARESRITSTLVLQLSHWNSDVATETSIALGKFVCPDNFLHSEHSKAIIEFGGVPPLIRMLRLSERPQLNGLVLLCYLALHAGDSEVLEREKVLPTLISARNNASSQHPLLRDLLHEAIRHLELYHAVSHSHV
ncbi:unnamed protein product [Spirodela intermedia]|nr:unnamed protein product [Spirodela intermedia]CAA6667975.1 unnamed protein product [Spirodela intermedia]